MRAQDKTVLITGASSGIGEALAREFFRRGSRLVLCARRLDRMEKLARELDPSGSRILCVACDVTREADVGAAVGRSVQKFGSLDVVVANAGFGVVGMFESLTVDDYRRQFDTNVFGVIHTVRASLEALKKSKGQLALIGSVNSYVSLPSVSAYAMSKFAVKALADSLHYELKPYGIGTTLICPGFVQSEIRQVDNKGVHHSGKGDIVPSWIQMPAMTAARKIARAILCRRRERVVTGHGWWTVFLYRHFPCFVTKIISLGKVQGRPEPQAKG